MTWTASSPQSQAAVRNILEINDQLQALYRHRKDLGVSVGTIAKKIGVTKKRVRSWESEYRSPTIRQIRVYANALGRSVSLTFEEF